jgi:hypothetical protein
MMTDRKTIFSYIIFKHRCNEEESLFELPFHQEETSAFLEIVGGVLTNLQFVKRLIINAFLSEL